MNIEIERKYKITKLPCLEELESKNIEQDYLYKDKFSAIRKRKITDKEGEKYLYTCKCKIGCEKKSSVELEEEIGKEKYDSLGKGYGNIINKTRYLYKLDRGLVAEVDIFNGIFSGIAIVEVEFGSLEEAEAFEKPDWFGEEINGELNCGLKWSNARLAAMNSEEIEKLKEELSVK